MAKHRPDHARPPRPTSQRTFAIFAALAGSLTVTGVALHYLTPPPIHPTRGVDPFPILGGMVGYDLPAPPATPTSPAPPATAPTPVAHPAPSARRQPASSVARKSRPAHRQAHRQPS